jgi:predicted ATPase
MPIVVNLPLPWPPNTTFTLDDDLPAITWLVGANGTGKSRFLRELSTHTELARFGPRLVSTDRLSAVRSDDTAKGVWGDRSEGGIGKGYFSRIANLSQRDGSLLGTVVLLHERSDLRMRVEATLSQLLDRHIRLEMFDGNLLPKVRYGASAEYGMFSHECHGVLELLVLLANIYDNKTSLLLIDEPEQHLHPQYQAFILGELQRSGKKAILATHSSSFLAVKTLDELRGVVCFHHDFRPPSRYIGEPQIDHEVAQILPRMTEQHRAFFFARSPVFVEGYFDATIIGAIQRSVGLSAEAAGSCLIPAMGKDEAGRYLMLCNALGKKACFFFDLDALFDRRLSIGAEQDSDLSARIADAGHGELKEMTGRLLRWLTEAVAAIEAESASTTVSELTEMRQFFALNAGKDNLNKRRLALLVALAEKFDAVRQVLGKIADQIGGLLRAVLIHLSNSDIHVLPGGALENYLPSYIGNRFKVPDESKHSVTMAEQAWLAKPRNESDVAERYHDLVAIIRKLPSRPVVDVRPTLRRELAYLLHHLVVCIRTGQIERAEHIPVVLGEDWNRVANFVELAAINIRSRTEFDGTLVILDRFGIGECTCRFDEQTQTSNPDALSLTVPSSTKQIQYVSSAQS